MSNTITLTVNELEQFLCDQRKIVGEHMTRNLSVYSWYKDLESIDKAKVEMRSEALKAPYPHDFNVLKKYIK